MAQDGVPICVYMDSGRYMPFSEAGTNECTRVRDNRGKHVRIVSSYFDYSSVAVNWPFNQFIRSLNWAAIRNLVPNKRATY